MADGPLVIKKYNNRRLYNTETSRYITLEDLRQLIQAGREVKVLDARTGADLTKSVLLQIISEQEKDRDLLPITFLEKMIKVGDATARDVFQRYLSISLDAFLDAQREFDRRYRSFAGSVVNPLMWMIPGFAPPSPPAPERAAPAEPGRPQEPAKPADASPPAKPDESPAPPASDAAAAGSEAAEPPPDAGRPATEQEVRQLREQLAQIQKHLERIGHEAPK